MQCLFFWNGYEADGGGNLTLQADVAPSVAILRMRLSYPIAQYGTLTLRHGSNAIQFTNCRVVRNIVQQGAGAERWREITIEDRRWQWGESYSAVYGEFNISQAGQAEIEQSDQQLAVRCALAMGEIGYDVSQISPTRYTPTVWDGVNPAAALREIAERNGCTITLTPQNRLLVYRNNIGLPPLPDRRQMDFTAGVEPVTIPRALVYEGGETHTQHDIPLEPIAWDPAVRRYRDIDSLSYKPAGGWGPEDPDPVHGFLGVNAKFREIARRDIWRLYRVSGQFYLPLPPQVLQNRTNSGRLTPQQRREVNEVFTIRRGKEWRILPLLPNQLNLGGSTSGFDGQLAEVWGFTYDLNITNTNTLGMTSVADVNTNYPLAQNYSALITGQIPVPQANQQMQYTRRFQIDYDSGHVRFDHPTFFYDFADGERVPAIIRLRTAFPIKDGETAARICQQYWATPGGANNNLAKKLKDSSFGFEYASTTGQVGGPSNVSLISNKDAFIANATATIADEIRSYQVRTGYSAPYKGFVFDRTPDGVVRAIVWDVSQDGVGTTHIDYNMERPEAYLSLNEIRAQRVATYRLWAQQQQEAKTNRSVRPTNPRGRW